MHFSPPADIFGEQGIIVLMVVALVLFGSTQIPKLARSLGSAQKEFKKGLEEGGSEDGAGTKSAAPVRVTQATPPAAITPSGPDLVPSRVERRRLHGPLPDRSGAKPMSEGIGPEQLASAGGRTQRRRWLPFWSIQATEIVVALVFADISVHVANGGLLVGGAIALLGLAVTAQGPLGLFRICGQRLHVALAMVAVRRHRAGSLRARRFVRTSKGSSWSNSEPSGCSAWPP